MACLYLALTILGFTGVTFFMKWGGHRGGSPLGLATTLFVVAAAVTAVPLPWAGRPLFSGPTIFCGLLAGVGGAVALVFFANALKIGHYGFSVAVLHMSCLIPVIFSILFLNASLGLSKGVGLAFILLGLFLITTTNASANSKGGAPWTRWCVFIACAFFLNSIPQVAQSLVARSGPPSYAPFLFVNYFSGAMVLLVLAARGRHFDARAVLFGAGGAIGSVLGYACVLKALGYLSAPVVFPIALNGPVVAATVLSRLFFRERISWMGYLGILCGITGIVVLAR